MLYNISIEAKGGISMRHSYLCCGIAALLALQSVPQVSAAKESALLDVSGFAVMDENLVYIGADYLNAAGVLFDDQDKVPESPEKTSVDKALWDKPSVLIPRKGTLGNLFFVDKPFWTVDTLFWTDIDQSKVMPRFLYYALKTKNLAELNVGTAVPSLTTDVLNEVEVDIPDLDLQESIVSLLQAFDSTINVNSLTNDYLAA